MNQAVAPYILAVVVLVPLPVRADPESAACTTRVEYHTGFGLWGFGAVTPDDDLDGLAWDLGVHVAPGCTPWIVGARFTGFGQLEIDILDSDDGDQHSLGLIELAPTTGVALRGDRLSLIATAGPALTHVRPCRDTSTTTIGLAADVAVTVRLTDRVGIGAQWSTNINPERSGSAFMLRLEHVSP
jgi:hypothetical protein